MEDLEKILEKTIADIAALPEPAMRLKALASRLKSLGPYGAVRFLDLLYKIEDDRVAGRVLPVLVDPEGLRGELGDKGFRATFMASIELGLTRVSRLFTDLPPHEEGIAGYDKEEEVRMESMALGHRRALSKSFKKDTLDRLLSDPDTIVIANLLDNPRLIEKDVLKIASKRPNSPSILKLVAVHRRWSKRPAVKKAVALNPYTPPRTAIALLDSMLTQELSPVTTDLTLHPQVRAHAADILKQRKG